MTTTLTSRRAASSCRRRLLHHCSATGPLLGHFHQPTPVTTHGVFSMLFRKRPRPTLPVFQPLTASSPRLSLNFVHDIADFSLYDSHLGLVFLRQHRPLSSSDPRIFVVCDPVSRRHARFQPPVVNPLDDVPGRGIFGAALLSRGDVDDPAGDGGLRFDAVCVDVDVDRPHPRAWVGSFRDGECHWRALPPSPDVAIEFHPYWLEKVCVRAAGGLYWHVCNHHSALALDAATLEFSFLPTPAAMSQRVHKYRVGEMPEDGRLCVASLEQLGLQLWVRGSGKGSDNGWVLERHVAMREVLDEVPWLPKNPLHRHATLYLSDIDAGRTGRVFVRSVGGRGRFSYHLDTGELECLETEDGMQYGHPIIPFFSAPANGGSD